MDPKVVVQKWIDAVKSRDNVTVRECIEAYRDWRLKGGFAAVLVFKTWSDLYYDVGQAIVHSLGTRLITCIRSNNVSTFKVDVDDISEVVNQL